MCVSQEGMDYLRCPAFLDIYWTQHSPYLLLLILKQLPTLMTKSSKQKILSKDKEIF